MEPSSSEITNKLTKYPTIMLCNTPVVFATILHPLFKFKFFSSHESTLACFGTSKNDLEEDFQDEAKKHFTTPSDFAEDTQNIRMARLFDELYT
ncbi:hypothetical protein O181_095357 [Austropuccinia psidii MF-1]|uniref:Uncharacterized protein n=1 Tax=Austropuccinia psidii MF-1 TaxID=1389203 RepID=A0A9Q3J4M8_9BASI|nr:hypothetical protein [Austropuccinia psidii MF-1]